MRYELILFDADNTLLDYDRASAQALRRALARHRLPVPFPELLARYRRINNGYWKQLEEGRIDPETLKTARFADLLAEIGTVGDAVALSHDYLAALAQTAHLVPHARHAVVTCRQRARTAVLTNGLSTVQRPRLRAAGLDPLFEAVIVSEEVGLAKPDPRFFQHALDHLRTPASLRVLMVGDNPETDIQGADRVGLATCWFNPVGHRRPAGVCPTHTITDLRCLAELL